MDIQTPFIFVGLFSIASVILFLIYKFGIKEKSYEEALAEQRQQTNMLLGIKPKTKEKKGKKVVKKNKKENEGADDNETTESVNLDQPEGHKNKPHVEFKEVPEEVPVKNNNTVTKKQSKKEKVRPILVNKDTVEPKIVIAAYSSTTENHFEELHPKDEFELMRSNSRENLLSKEPLKASKVAKQVKSEPVEVVQQKEAPKKPLESVSVQKTAAIAPTTTNGIGNTGKEKKKKKSEFNTLQQLAAAGDANGPNMPLLLNLVRKAELSRSEVQILIDLLLNKQHEAPEILDEWSEGKSDPIQKLKKQLAEKEKLLLEEQQVSLNAQSKLREIRGEHQSEKSQLQQKIRGLEEMLHNKQVEGGKLHQQLQQLQAQLKEELVKNHKLRDEQGAIQMQRQQFEIRLAKLQETEVIIAQLQSEVAELSGANNHLRIELSRLSEESSVEKERQQGLIMQLNNVQKELEQKNKQNRFLQDNNVELQHTLETSIKQGNEFKSEISHLKTNLQQKLEELRRLELSKKQFSEELQKSKDETSKLLQKLQDLQNAHMNGVNQTNKQQDVEILNLQNELSSLKTELGQAEKKYRDELKIADSTVERLKSELEAEKLKLEEQKSKNNELRIKNWKVMEALNAAESKLKSSNSNSKNLPQKSSEDVHKEFIERLFPEIRELSSIKPELFQSESEKLIRNYIEDLKQGSEVVTLKSQLQHYKNVIDNTEKMLNKLQQHIEQEEIHWRTQLAAKTAELEAIKENQGLNLQEKLACLENELREEKAEKKRLVNELREAKASSGSTNNDVTQNGLH